MSKVIWNFLLILIGGLSLWRGIAAAKELWNYNCLKIEVPASQVFFEIIPYRGKYALEGSYAYEYGKKSFQGNIVLSPPHHLNRNSAEQEIKRMEGMQWNVWVDPIKPSNSSLEKNFPYRNVFYAVCLLGLFLYFVSLRFYLQLFARRT